MNNDNILKITPKFISAAQIHQKNITLVDGRTNFIPRSDGLITRHKVFLAVRTADCLPIFLINPRKRIVCAIHAGWKGLQSGIIENAIYNMKKLGSDVTDIIAAAGPHIGVCCYKVDKSRVLLFKSLTNGLEKISAVKKNNWYLDLGKVAYLNMVNSGLLKKNIEILPICTSCSGRFFSFRRDGKSNLTMLNIIGMV